LFRFEIVTRRFQNTARSLASGERISTLWLRCSLARASEDRIMRVAISANGSRQFPFMLFCSISRETFSVIRQGNTVPAFPYFLGGIYPEGIEKVTRYN
jgi:hypothetical protein